MREYLREEGGGGKKEKGGKKRKEETVSPDIVTEILASGMPDYPNIPYTKRRLFHYHLSGISIGRPTGYERADTRVYTPSQSVHIIRGIMRYPREIPGVA